MQHISRILIYRIRIYNFEIPENGHFRHRGSFFGQNFQFPLKLNYSNAAIFFYGGHPISTLFSRKKIPSTPFLYSTLAHCFFPSHLHHHHHHPHRALQLSVVVVPESASVVSVSPPAPPVVTAAGASVVSGSGDAVVVVVVAVVVVAVVWKKLRKKS